MSLRHGYWTGKKRSETTKEKLRKFRLGKKATDATKEKMRASSARKGKPSLMLGKRHSIETKKAISEKLKGEKSHTWKGGVTPENEIVRHSIEIKAWRLSVYERDGFTCQKCGQVGRELVAHHILNFSEFKEKRTDVVNGITFCQGCHQMFHKKYTKKNNSLEQLQEFLGTTGVACKNLNRSFIGIELSEEYFEIARKRIENTIVHNPTDTP